MQSREAWFVDVSKMSEMIDEMVISLKMDPSEDDSKKSYYINSFDETELNTEQEVTEKFDRNDKVAEAEDGVKWGDEDVWRSVAKCCKPWKDDGDSCARQFTGNVCDGCIYHDKTRMLAIVLRREIRGAKSGQRILDLEKHSPMWG